MATQATTVAAFQLLCAEVSDAIAAESWSTAYSKYAQAEAVNSALELNVSAQGTSVQRRHSLRALKDALDASMSVVGRLGEKDRFVHVRTKHNR